MTFPSRQTRREYLKTLLANSGSWQATYDHQPTSFQGQSPVATVHSGAAAPVTISMGRRQAVTMDLIVTNFIKREDPATAEDVLDTLLAKVVDVVNANRQVSAYWNDLQVKGATEPDYYIVDGEQYRGEVIHVEATIYASTI